MSYENDASAMLSALSRTPNWKRVQTLNQGGSSEAETQDDVVLLDDETVQFIVNEAAAVAVSVVAPLNSVSDRVGAQFAEGKVVVPAEFLQAFNTLADGGWLGLEQAERFGGQGLPLSLFAAVNPLFERACPAFMMSVGGTRAAALLLSSWADDATKNDWVPALVKGSRCATICISEPEAGSDVGRIRTRGRQDEDGNWFISGQKIWISFGDHDIRERIGHCMLARSNDTPGTRGLSLFLVENTHAVVTERIEEKLGLHGSPTCALRFDDAAAVLIGEEGRGLGQLFTMIRHMRLTVACQGLGAALECHNLASTHAAERRQGGRPDTPAVTINQHPDVRRQLLDMQSQIDLFRQALLESATAADLSETDPAMSSLCAWLLPLIKTFGAELAFNSASQAIQVLGGGGYTRDYSAEQVLRDARVFSIYEGTTGMQGQDFLLRQSLPDNAATVDIFLSVARGECQDHPVQLAILDDYADFTSRLTKLNPVQDRIRLAAMADGYLRAGWVAVQAWMSVRLTDDAVKQRFLATARPQLALHIANAKACGEEFQ